MQTAARYITAGETACLQYSGAHVRTGALEKITYRLCRRQSAEFLSPDWKGNHKCTTMLTMFLAFFSAAVSAATASAFVLDAAACEPK